MLSGGNDFPGFAKYQPNKDWSFSFFFSKYPFVNGKYFHLISRWRTLSANWLEITYMFPNRNLIFSTEIERYILVYILKENKMVLIPNQFSPPASYFRFNFMKEVMITWKSSKSLHWFTLILISLMCNYWLNLSCRPY